MKLAIVLGTRPEIIKLSPVIRYCILKKINFFIIHTNQHFSANMDQIFFEELDLPQPKYNLEARGSLHGLMTARQLELIEEILIEEKPNWVIVQGDTNTVLSGALAASKLNIKIAHIEAGLRSYDRSMPEEINRIITDHISNLLFPPTNKQGHILITEGIEPTKIKVVGNTIADAVLQNLDLAKKSCFWSKYQKQKYFLVTAHRPNNVDRKDNLEAIISAITELAKKYQTKIIFPIHPRCKQNLEKYNIKIDISLIDLIEPVGYLEMLSLIKNSQLVLTDSGGIQEEACILHVPSLTLRKNTERPETLEVGASVLTGVDQSEIATAAQKMLICEKNWHSPFGDGNSAQKIIDLVLRSDD